MSTNIQELLTAEELARVTRKDNLRATCIVLFDWSMVIGLFVLAAAFSNPLTILLTVILFGGRQMALGVLVHETGHKSFFTSQSVNDFVGTWLSGYWVFSDKNAYMEGHLMHHRDCGTADDPDLENFDAYPVSLTSFKRKVLRDISGKIGWRRIVSISRLLARLNKLKRGVKKF
jgi:fatty acid desaturase